MSKDDFVALVSGGDWLVTIQREGRVLPSFLMRNVRYIQSLDNIYGAGSAIALSNHVRIAKRKNGANVYYGNYAIKWRRA